MRTLPLDRRAALPLLVTALWILAPGADAWARSNDPPGKSPGQSPGQSVLQTATPAKSKEAPRVDLVIALDVSSSMDGLIDSARARLWDVVNLLAKAKPTPVVRIGLISYGHSGYSQSSGWVRKESELTTDLDAVYSKLFALTTSGGTEYVTRAVGEAIHHMQWEQSPNALKIIFVAGNEPADQDPTISLDASAADAREHHIVVNSIYCGKSTNAEFGRWRLLADRSSGMSAAIDQSAVAVVNTPVDSELARLSNELNNTYVAYGHKGKDKLANQAAQDHNAGSMGLSAAASRATAKSSALYANDEWDLVDARAHHKAPAAMPAAALPEPMRAMSPVEQEKFLAGKAEERAKLQKKIGELSEQRSGYLHAARKSRATVSFDDALDATVRKEGAAGGLHFE